MKEKRQNQITVGFVALGCPKNIVDSERMLARIAQAGFIIDSTPENADVVVINTCGFIAPARAEALEVIDHFVRCKEKGRVKKVIVAGCLPQREKEKLFAKAGKIDAIVGLDYGDNIAEIIKSALQNEMPLSYVGENLNRISDDRVRFPITPAHWSYLRISEGCSHNCSFCTIPAIRGRFRSKPIGQIAAEAEELVSAGAVELNIIGQDTTGYGKDLKIKDGLVKVITGLEKIERLKWIRLMYLWPTGITDELLKAIAESEKVVHYIDVPIQHINNQILKAMHRPDTKGKITAMIEKLRKVVPDIVLRTTIIVGFPGETDGQFAELLDFIKWAGFDALGGFPYYAEEGTAAAKMPGQVPEGIKQQRLAELMLTQQRIAFKKNKERVGSELVCLVDSAGNNKHSIGRYFGQAPQIDSVCIINNYTARPGRFIKTKVVDTKDYDLVVEQMND
jgi:ribosomal protein S12 methylthiotransferase